MSESLFENVDIEKELAAAEEAVEETPEETPEEPKEAEAVEESHPEDDNPKAKNEVEFGAFHRERERRKAAQAKLDEIEQKYATLESRINQINEAAQRAKEVDYEDDPAAYLKSQVEKTSQSVEEVNKRIEEHDRQAQEAQRLESLRNSIIASEQDFASQAPDYYDAVKFLRDGRAQEYRAMGFTDPAMINQWLSNEALNLANIAEKNGTSPAELAYNLAKARGWAAPKGEKPKSDEKLETIERGQQRNKSLTGGQPEPVLDAEALANMSDEEFAEAMKGGKWSKILKDS